MGASGSQPDLLLQMPALETHRSTPVADTSQ